MKALFKAALFLAGTITLAVAQSSTATQEDKLAYHRLFRDWQIRAHEKPSRKEFDELSARLAKDAHYHVPFLRFQLIGEPALVPVINANPVLAAFAGSGNYPAEERHYSDPECQKLAGILRAYEKSH